MTAEKVNEQTILLNDRDRLSFMVWPNRGQSEEISLEIDGKKIFIEVYLEEVYEDLKRESATAALTVTVKTGDRNEKQKT